MRSWVGLPYQEGGRGPEAYDCLGLFLALQAEEAGRVITFARPAKTAQEKREAFLQLSAIPGVREVEVKCARRGDALVFRIPGGLHVGYALNEVDMIHIADDGARSCIERWRTGAWWGKLVGVWRYG